MTSCRKGGGGVPFSMTRHDKRGRGGHEVHDIMLGEKLTLHQIINYLKDKIGVVFLRSCVIFDTL